MTVQLLEFFLTAPLMPTGNLRQFVHSLHMPGRSRDHRLSVWPGSGPVDAEGLHQFLRGRGSPGRWGQAEACAPKNTVRRRHPHHGRGVIARPVHGTSSKASWIRLASAGVATPHSSVPGIRLGSVQAGFHYVQVHTDLFWPLLHVGAGRGSWTPWVSPFPPKQM